jgi:hypothetical protein
MSENKPLDSGFDCDALLDVIPEYAFGFTDAEQTRWVEANLERCPEAAAQLQDYRSLQDEMRTSVAQVEPSAQVGARLMAAITAPAAAAPAPATSMTVRPPAPMPAPAEQPVAAAVPVATPSTKPRSRMRAAWWVAAAAVLALVATNIYWLTRVADLTQANDLLTAFRNAQDNSAFVLTNTDSLHWVRLADDQPDGDAAAFMMWNAQSKTGLLYARSFPELEPGYKYHLWLTRNGERTFMGILQVDDEGDGALLFNSPEPINDFGWAWVTAEDGTQPPNSAPAIVKGELNPA